MVIGYMQDFRLTGLLNDVYQTLGVIIFSPLCICITFTNTKT